MLFYVGTHKPSHAAHLERAFISINTVRNRKAPVPGREWIMDSGAFTEISKYGGYRHGPEQYAADIKRIAALNPNLSAVVSQDWMCEPSILQRTGLSIREHQRLTIARYDALLHLLADRPYLMPVLQGYKVHEYLEHLDQYGDRLKSGMLVGVGSVCKRNGDPYQVESVLTAIKLKRQDLRLHGFGIKTTSLASDLVRRCLYSADSMAWSFAARYEGRNGNHWSEAVAFARKIENQPVQQWLFPIASF